MGLSTNFSTQVLEYSSNRGLGYFLDFLGLLKCKTVFHLPFCQPSHLLIKRRSSRLIIHKNDNVSDPLRWLELEIQRIYYFVIWPLDFFIHKCQCFTRSNLCKKYLVIIKYAIWTYFEIFKNISRLFKSLESNSGWINLLITL
jgi:hypothetical protein